MGIHGTSTRVHTWDASFSLILTCMVFLTKPHNISNWQELGGAVASFTTTRNLVGPQRPYPLCMSGLNCPSPVTTSKEHFASSCFHPENYVEHQRVFSERLNAKLAGTELTINDDCPGWWLMTINKKYLKYECSMKRRYKEPIIDKHETM